MKRKAESEGLSQGFSMVHKAFSHQVLDYHSCCISVRYLTVFSLCPEFTSTRLV